jgi:subtilisin family serine protease
MSGSRNFRGRAWLLCVLALALAVTAGAAEREATSQTNLSKTVQALEEQAARELKSEPVESNGAVESPSAPFDATPPSGASHYDSEIDATVVRGTEERRKRSAAKPLATAEEQYFSNSNEEGLAPDHWRQLGFSSGSFAPQPGLDRGLVAVGRERGMGRGHVYAFLLMNELITSETRAELDDLGATILGSHSGALKVKLPRGEAQLRAIADLPYVEWVALSQPEQKMSIPLQQALTELASPDDRYPIVVNLFDQDPDQNFRRNLESAGVAVMDWHPDLLAYTAVASRFAIESIVARDFVLFVELIPSGRSLHSQSTPTIGADYIRPGPGLTSGRYDGDSTILGIMDSGFMLGGGAAVAHQDLNRNGCGINFTTDAAGVWNDENGHGSHVLGTIIGTGTADSRFKGMATGVGNTNRIRAAKVFDSAGNFAGQWVLDAMDYMDDATSCEAGRPDVVNFSGGTNNCTLIGTDALSRKLDSKTWDFDQLYVISAGNSGPNPTTVCSPGVAKDALTVGNVLDFDYLAVGDIWTSSSRGPTGDGRMKPNLVAPGRWVTSVDAGTTNQYLTISGTSMAAPHVSGLVATLMDHYADFTGRPSLTRAWLMATSLLHNDTTSPDDNDTGGTRPNYGLGRVSSRTAHWENNNSSGWDGSWSWSSVTSSNYIYRDVTVPSGARRLVVAMTWDEPAASSGASQAVIDDIDLWIDRGVDCTGTLGRCGEWNSDSTTDNVEYIIINNPSAATYRIKATPWSVSAGRPVGLGIVVVRGDTTPDTSLSAVASTATPFLNTDFTVTTTVSNPSWVASGVHLERTSFPSGVTLQSVTTKREDNITMDFGTATELTLGNISQGDSRSAVWTFRASTTGSKTLTFRSWSENGGTRTDSVTVSPGLPDLIVPSLSLTDASLTIGETFTINAAVQNIGTAPSASTTLRYYRSTNSTISSFDTQIGTDFVLALSPGGSSAESISVSAPSTTGTWYIGACVDTVAGETVTSNQCYTPGIEINVGPPFDLLIQNISYGGPAVVEACNSITIGPNVFLDAGSDVTFRAPTVLLRDGVGMDLGIQCVIDPAVPVDCPP